MSGPIRQGFGASVDANGRRVVSPPSLLTHCVICEKLVERSAYTNYCAICNKTFRYCNWCISQNYAVDFSKVNGRGNTVYFCGTDCMDCKYFR